MGTVGQQVSVSAAISNSISGFSGLLYTCPANSYAIINVYIGITFSTNINTCRVFVGGQPVLLGQNTILVNGQSPTIIQSGNSESSAVNGLYVTKSGIVVGPGQEVTFNFSASAGQVSISGVQFTNGS